MKNYFTTPDFVLASTLLCLGFSVEALDPADPTRVQFCFAQTQELTDAIQLFWQRQLRVEPLAFSAAQKILKSRLNNESRTARTSA